MHIRRLAVGMMVFVLVLTFKATAQEDFDLAKLVPQDTLLYVNFNLKDKNDKATAMSRLLEDEAVKGFIDSCLKNTAEDTDTEIEKEFDEFVKSGKFKKMLINLFKGRVALYVPTIKITGKLNFTTQVNIVAQIDNTSGDVENITGRFKALLSEEYDFTEIAGEKFKTIKIASKKAKDHPFCFSYNNDFLVLSNEPEVANDLFDGIAKGGIANNITDNENYTKILNGSPKDLANCGFLNIEKVITLIPAPTPPAPPAGQGNPALTASVITPEKVLSALGLSSVKSIGWYGYTEKDGSIISNSLIYAPGEKKGLLKLLCSSPAQMNLPTYYPKTLGVYEAFRISPENLFNNIVEISASLNPSYRMLIEMGLESVKQQHGLDIKEQLLKTFGEEHSFALIFKNMPTDLSAVNPRMAPMVMGFDLAKSLLITAELKDVELFKNTVTTLQAIGAKYNPIFSSKIEEEYNGKKITVVGMSMPGAPVACYFINNNRLYFALNKSTLKIIIDGFGNKDAGLAADPLLQKTFGVVGNADSVGMLTMNEGVYLGYYSEIVKQFMQFAGAKEKAMLHEKRLMERAKQKAESADANKGNNDKEAVTPADAEQELSSIEKLIDFSLWPKPEVFKKYFGFTVVKMLPSDDGIILKGCSKPKPLQ